MEVIIYVHGITPSPTPGLHTADYDRFHDLLTQELSTLGKPLLKPENRIDIEWGYRGPNITTDDRILAETERYLYQKAEEEADKHWDVTINPLRLAYSAIRKSFLLGFTDMFYYISEDGKAEVRRNVLRSILNKLPPLPDDDRYSITIISHSAGTVIMHDLLYLIFGNGGNHFLERDSDIALLEKIRQYARNGRFQVRLFVTMGSPITSMIVRSKNLLEIINNNGDLHGKIQLDTIGIKKHARWLNFWDKDDIISYPVAFLYNNQNDLLEDCYVDVGDSFPDVHSAYWGAKDVAEKVAFDF